MAAGPACPICAHPSRPILYGFPSSEMFEQEERGEIRLGGCVLSDDSPDFVCTNPDQAHEFSASAAHWMNG